MAKNITKLNLDQLQAIVGGVSREITASATVNTSATMYRPVTVSASGSVYVSAALR